MDGSIFAWYKAGSFAVGSVGWDWMKADHPIDVLIEVATQSMDGNRLSRPAIRHFVIQGDRVERVDPVALSRRDFVDEWLVQPWTESAAWSAAATLGEWHRKVAPDGIREFDRTTMHCQTPDLWQVGFRPINPQKNYRRDPEVYFLVRWRPPYHFTMVNVSDKPWPRCSQPDPEADEWRTLFNTQDWRQ